MQDFIFGLTFLSRCLVQALFLEPSRIEKLDEENVFEVNWLMGLLRELMVSMFIWVSKNKEINATTEEHVSLQTDKAKHVSDFPPFCYSFKVSLDGGFRMVLEEIFLEI